MADYYSVGEFSKLLNVTPQTLRNWDRTGRLKPDHIRANGHRYYSKEQLNQVLNVKPNAKRIVIGYCRVSSRKQKDDLDRQVENIKIYLMAQGEPFDIITDIGSGINYKKKGLKELLERIVRGEASKIVVLHKDRLMRFGFEMVEYLASLYGCEIEAIDNTDKDEQQELVEDLIQIITIFRCRLHGRWQKRTKELLSDLRKGEGEPDAESI